MTKKIDDDLIDELLKGCERPEDLLGDGGLMQGLKRALMQRMLGAELTDHLGYEPGETPPPVQPNRRNGTGRKTVKGETGTFEIDVPRDRDGSFEPRLIGKGQTRIDGLDDKIVAMYARGMSVRDIRSHLEDLYGIEVSPDLISRVTDAVLDEVKEWRSRALDAVYPVVIFDALRVKIRDKDSRIVKSSPRGRHRSEARGGRRLPGPRYHLGRHPGGSRSLDRGERGRQVLARRHERAAQPRGPGHPDRRRGRAEGLPRGDHRRLSRDHGADMHRASGPPLPELLLLEGSQGGGCRAPRGLRRGHRRDGLGRAVRRAILPPEGSLGPAHPSTRNGAGSIRRSRRPGAAPGRRSSRSSRSAPKSAG